MKPKHFFFLLLIYGCSVSSQFEKKLATTFYQEDDFISFMQGATSEHETVINFLVPENMEYTYSILDEENNEVPSENLIEKTYAFFESPWKIVEIEINKLKRKENYRFNISLKKGGFVKKESRSFSTLDLKKENIEILLASCLTDSYGKIAENAWMTISSRNVDAVFLIGDLVYADYRNDRYLGIPADSLKSIWSRYVDTRNRVPLFKMKKLKPVFSIWDDHDTGMNDADKNYKFIKETKDIFRRFFPVNNNSIIDLGIGMGFHLAIAKNHFYFLDNRSFRDSNDDPRGEHIGKEQTSWLLKKIKNNQGTQWPILGDQFFGAYHKFESFEGKHPLKFNQLIEKLKITKKKFIFLSGDRHLYEFAKIEKEVLGNVSYEITTSGLHAKVFPLIGGKIQNPRRINIIDNQHNAVILSLNESMSSFEVINEKGETLDKQILNLNN